MKQGVYKSKIRIWFDRKESGHMLNPFGEEIFVTEKLPTPENVLVTLISSEQDSDLVRCEFLRGNVLVYRVFISELDFNACFERIV